MSRFDMKEFGEAAPFLRKTDLQLMAARTVAFDGRPEKGHLKVTEPYRSHYIKRVISYLNIVFWGILNVH